jgi:tetratricopeptide (TPR) repeat protein
MGSGGPEHLTQERSAEENSRAEELIGAGNIPEAADILVRIIDSDSGNWRAYNNLGVISWSKKNWEDAYVLFRKAVSTNPLYADALVNLFDAALKLKRVREIHPLFENALAADTSLEEIKIIRDSIVNLGEEIYRSNRALEIGTYSPLVEKADAELEAGNLFTAMELYLKANDTEGPSAEAYSGLGIISFYQQRYLDAYTLFVESIKLNPANPETFLNLLDAAKACDKMPNAKEIFAVCRKEYPALEGIAGEFEGADSAPMLP